MLRRTLVLSCLTFGLGLLVPAPVLAQQGAAQAIERLNATLLDVMRNASVGYRGRAQRLQPVLTSTYDLAQMGQVAVGRTWSTTPPDQQRQLVDLFTQFTVASYASRFNGYSGERFEVLGEQQAANGMVMVRTQIVRSNDRPVPINYLMRRQSDAWRVVDVFLDSAISEVARRRSEFGSVIARGGMESLLQTLRDRIAQIERDTPR